MLKKKSSLIHNLNHKMNRIWSGCVWLSIWKINHSFYRFEKYLSNDIILCRVIKDIEWYKKWKKFLFNINFWLPYITSITSLGFDYLCSYSEWYFLVENNNKFFYLKWDNNKNNFAYFGDSLDIDYADRFVEWLACIWKKDQTGKYKYWFINKDGDFLWNKGNIKDWMDCVSNFSNWFAKVKKKWKYWLIDKDGNFIGWNTNFKNWVDNIGNTYFDRIFWNRLFQLGKDFNILYVEKSWKFNFIDRTGKILLSEWLDINKLQVHEILEYYLCGDAEENDGVTVYFKYRNARGIILLKIRKFEENVEYTLL